MDTLNDFIVAKIGTYLDIHDRCACFEASKAFQAVNYTFQSHGIYIKTGRALGRAFNSKHLAYLFKIKPLLNWLCIDFKEITSVRWFNPHALERFLAILQARDVAVDIWFVDCSVSVMVRVLQVFNKVRFLNVRLRFRIGYAPNTHHAMLGGDYMPTEELRKIITSYPSTFMDLYVGIAMNNLQWTTLTPLQDCWIAVNSEIASWTTKEVVVPGDIKGTLVLQMMSPCLYHNAHHATHLLFDMLTMPVHSFDMSTSFLERYKHEESRLKTIYLYTNFENMESPDNWFYMFLRNIPNKHAISVVIVARDTGVFGFVDRIREEYGFRNVVIAACNSQQFAIARMLQILHDTPYDMILQATEQDRPCMNDILPMNVGELADYLGTFDDAQLKYRVSAFKKNKASMPIIDHPFRMTTYDSIWSAFYNPEEGPICAQTTLCL